jgi:Ca-activated chloride channel homolog
MISIAPMTDAELHDLSERDDAGVGTLRTARGNLPLETLTLTAGITGLFARTELVQGFHNPHDVPLEATYVFPLPDRAAVTGLRMTADDRVVEAVLKERGQARAEYDQAIAIGQRAAIAEEERPDVFTMRVGNILPRERVTVALSLAGRLSYEDCEATYRFPLVVAPRYIPGAPLTGGPVGDGSAPDTDAVPDASRITPPVLLPGFPAPVRLAIEMRVDSGGLPLGQPRATLPMEYTENGVWRVRPGQRADRDFVVRLPYGDAARPTHALACHPDATGSGGTFQLTLLPPASAAPPRPRDVVLVLDRSGSMGGWKMAAARRAAARIVDTLTTMDRFTVLTFDTVVERPETLPAEGLATASDRHRFRAVEHLARVEARGGTELLAPLREALNLRGPGALGGAPTRDRVLVLVTDGQVGNEDQILAEAGPALADVRLHAVGIDRAVNAGFLGRLAALGGGRCELVESEDRLDEAMDIVHRRIGAPLVTGLSMHPRGLAVDADTVAPRRLPDLFPAAPVVVAGRYTGVPEGAVRVDGTAAGGGAWSAEPAASIVANEALAAVWARAHLRDLEDAYVARLDGGDPGDLEKRIVATSLRFGVLCRFTAYVAVDSRVATDGSAPHQVIQPVEPAAGWQMLSSFTPYSPYAPDAGPPMRTRSRAGRQVAIPLGAFAADSPAAAGVEGFTAEAEEMSVLPGREATARPAGAAAAPEMGLTGRLAVEAAGLRAAAGEPEWDRRIMLADLASRLDALLRGAYGELADRLRRFLVELAGEVVLRVPSDEFARLWSRMLDLLEGRTERHGGFWKRT